MLFAMLVLVQKLHAAIARDAVADVDHEIIFGQVQKAVDGPRFEPAARLDGPGLLPMKQLVIAQHDNAGIDQPKSCPNFADKQLSRRS